MNQDTFIDYLKTNGWEMRKGKKYNPFILHRNLKEFNYPLFVFPKFFEISCLVMS